MIIVNQNIKVITKCQQNVNYHFINTVLHEEGGNINIVSGIKWGAEVRYSTVLQFTKNSLK